MAYTARVDTILWRKLATLDWLHAKWRRAYTKSSADSIGYTMRSLSHGLYSVDPASIL